MSASTLIGLNNAEGLYDPIQGTVHLNPAINHNNGCNKYDKPRLRYVYHEMMHLLPNVIGLDLSLNQKKWIAIIMCTNIVSITVIIAATYTVRNSVQLINKCHKDIKHLCIIRFLNTIIMIFRYALHDR